LSILYSLVVPLSLYKLPLSDNSYLIISVSSVHVAFIFILSSVISFTSNVHSGALLSCLVSTHLLSVT